MRDSQPKSKPSPPPTGPSSRDPFDLLEAYVDDELSGEDRRFVERSLATAPGLAAELALARRIQAGLRSMPKQSCPESVSRRVSDQVLGKLEAPRAPGAGPPKNKPHHPTRLGNGPFGGSSDGWTAGWRAAFVALGRHPARLAAGLALIATAWISHSALVDVHPISPPSALSRSDHLATSAAHETASSPSESPDQAPSAQEVARAEQEVKLALAYLGKLGRTAGKSVVQITGESAARAKGPNS